MRALPAALLGGLAAALGPGGVALAHEGQPPAPHDLWTAWSWEPGVLLGLALAGWAYARGVAALWRRAGPGRGPLAASWAARGARRGLRRWQAAAFAGGWLALVLALVTPLAALGAALFSAHMVQHLLLTLGAAPLLVLGAPHHAFLWALPRPARRALGRWWRQAGLLRAGWRALGAPLVAWGLSVGALWVWHAPGLYQAALASDLVHLAEHASLLGTALLFWWPALARGRAGRLGGVPNAPRRRVGVPLGPGSAALYLFAASLQSSVLGALITFASAPWYPAYATSAAAWGLTPQQDQQLAGILMWGPAGLVYLAATLLPLAHLLGGAEGHPMPPPGRHGDPAEGHPERPIRSPGDPAEPAAGAVERGR